MPAATASSATTGVRTVHRVTAANGTVPSSSAETTIARPRPTTRNRSLLVWAGQHAVKHGFVGVTVACEPTRHQWKAVMGLADGAGMGSCACSRWRCTGPGKATTTPWIRATIDVERRDLVAQRGAIPLQGVFAGAVEALERHPEQTGERAEDDDAAPHPGRPGPKTGADGSNGTGTRRSRRPAWNLTELVERSTTRREARVPPTSQCVPRSCTMDRRQVLWFGWPMTSSDRGRLARPRRPVRVPARLGRPSPDRAPVLPFAIMLAPSAAGSAAALTNREER
jgi:hypothetical protein